MKFIIGKKIEMTQIWQNGKVLAVTKIQAGPCLIAQIKEKDKDGYQAVQLGFGEKKENNIKKPQLGHLKNIKIQKSAVGAKRADAKYNIRYLREFRVNDLDMINNIKAGDMIDVSTFASGDKVKVSGISKGKGFQGVVKRHGFHGQDKTHGNKDQLRMSGSIGATGPQHVFKGMRMPGRMGGERITLKNLIVSDIDQKNNLLFIKGAVPGARNSLVLIQGEGELKIMAPKKAIEHLETPVAEKIEQGVILNTANMEKK